MENKGSSASGKLSISWYIIRKVTVEAKTETEVWRIVRENEVESVRGLRRIWEEYLKLRGVEANIFSNIPGLGRQLTEEELSQLRQGSKRG